MNRNASRAGPIAAPAKPRSGRFTGTGLFPLSASLILLLSGCSNAPSIPPTLPPANLASPCEAIAELPVPFLDPARLIWEEQLVALYAECAAKHRHLVEAWPD